MTSRSMLTSVLIASLGLASSVLAQSTAFTYQGRLKNGAQPAAGLYDFRFTLFNAATGGVAVAPLQCMDNVTVAEGLFTTAIDFGQSFTTTTGLFIQIEARADTGLGCGNATGFTVLSPRQPVTATPIANHAKSAYALDAADGSPANAVSVDNAGNVGIGTAAPSHPLHIANAAPTLALQDTDSSGGAGGQQVGYVSYRDSGNVERAWVGYGSPGDPDFSIINARPGGDIVLNAFGGGNVGIGTVAPTHSLHIANAAPTLALQDTNSAADQVGYISYRDAANTEKAWVGYGTAGDPDFSIVNARAGGNIVLAAFGGGDVRIGAGGQYRVAACDESLRMLRGSILSSGAIQAGSGFTVERVGTGLYRITFDTAFSGLPSVTVSAVQPFNQSPRWGTIHPNTITNGLVDIFILNGNASATNSDFHFIVMGPR